LFWVVFVFFFFVFLFCGFFFLFFVVFFFLFVVGFFVFLFFFFFVQVRREWQPAALDEGIVYLPDATALLGGVGGIGGETARLLAAFGVRVVGIDARRADVPEGVAEMHAPDELDRLLPTADFVILTIPHTPETEGLFNAERFQRMRRSAFFINIGRGMTTRLDDLVQALNDGWIAGAALDVFEIEPLPAEHPLWQAPNVLITPHTAGYGPHLDERRFEIILDNARRFLAGEPLRNVVVKAHWF
jgi:phosphoglycerate dehydrogenase-like enzyme